MNHSDYSNLNFDRPQRRIPGRAIWVGALLGVVGLGWLVLPAGAFFWLILVLVGALGWASSYGWRQPVQILITLLNRVQTL